jgi:serine protease Do
VAGMPVGKEVPVKILREGAEQTVKLQIAERKETEQASKSQAPESEDLGIRAADLNPDTARRFGIDENETGVLVVEVRPGSKASQAGLQQGDIVKEVNRVPIHTVSELKTEFRKAQSGDTVPLLVKRDPGRFLVVKVTR